LVRLQRITPNLTPQNFYKRNQKDSLICHTHHLDEKELTGSRLLEVGRCSFRQTVYTVEIFHLLTKSYLPFFVRVQNTTPICLKKPIQTHNTNLFQRQIFTFPLLSWWFHKNSQRNLWRLLEQYFLHTKCSPFCSTISETFVKSLFSLCKVLLQHFHY